MEDKKLADFIQVVVEMLKFFFEIKTELTK